MPCNLERSRPGWPGEWARAGMKIGSILGIAAVLAVAVWLAAWGENWGRAYAFTGRQDDYYNLLVHGFLKGHLYLDTAVDPRLLSPNPAVRGQAQGGGGCQLLPGTILHLFPASCPPCSSSCPIASLTGQDLSENAACLAIVLLGFLLYLRIYGEARRRYFPGLSPPLRAASVLRLAFGAGTPSLLILSGRYEIAIAGGYACLAGAWLGIFRAGHSERHAAAWLGAASAALGLAVGCRPTCLLMAPALALAAVLLLRAPRPAGAGAGPLRLAAAAVHPAILIGLLLAGYNYARFGNPLEFGFSYQPYNSVLLGSGHPTSSAQAAFFWPNLQWYYLRPSTLSPHFPYVFPIDFRHPPANYVGGEASHGQWPAFLLGLCCVLRDGRIVARRRRPAPSPGTFSLPPGGRRFHFHAGGHRLLFLHHQPLYRSIFRGSLRLSSWR